MLIFSKVFHKSCPQFSSEKLPLMGTIYVLTVSEHYPHNDRIMHKIWIISISDFLPKPTSSRKVQQQNFFTASSFLFSPFTAEVIWFKFDLPQQFLHTSHQSLEKMQFFEAIFEIFGWAIFEAIEVKGGSMLNFEAAISKFCNHFWKFGCQPRKSNANLCMANGSKVLIYLSFLLFVKDLLL